MRCNETRQACYVGGNKEARSCNHCCNGKTLSMAESECVFVALGIQHAMRLRHIFFCGLPPSTVFFHIISLTARFKKRVTEHKMCVLIFSTTFV